MAIVLMVLSTPFYEVAGPAAARLPVDFMPDNIKRRRVGTRHAILESR